MAENKKSVVIYCDLIHTVDGLRDVEAGRLFKYFLRYVNDMNPTAPDRFTEIIFEPIKQQLKRDLKKWEKTIEGKVKAGLASAEKRKQNQHVLTPVENAEHSSTNPTVSVSVSVTDKKNNIDSRKLKFASTLEPFLQKYGRPMLVEFSKYWTEPNKTNTKFRQELEKTWDLERRLETWAKNDKNFNRQPVVNNHDTDGIL